MEIIEWTATAVSITGAFAVALKRGWGFVLFAVSNLLWISWGLMVPAHGLVVTQAVFLVSSILGMVVWARKCQ